MPTQADVANVELHAWREDERGDHLTNLTVHFKLSTSLGEFQVAVPVEDARGLDLGVHDARERLAQWAASVARAARG